MRFLFAVIVFLLLSAAPVFAHFGAVIPSADMISAGDPLTLGFELKFIHPMQQVYMDMDRPREFGVVHRGQRQDLLPSLRQAHHQEPDSEHHFTYWRGDFTVKRPGDHTFYLVPQPYWEASEDLFIIHYTKVTVAALGLSKGWDQPVGLETEIVPLSRPYGLWSGNLFSGQVLLQGKPVPYAVVEVEYLNEATGDGTVVIPPADPFVTQVVKADGDGVFHYALPRAGWWGFSALSTATWTLPHAGEAKPVEIGAVFWVHARDMVEGKR